MNQQSNHQGSETPSEEQKTKQALELKKLELDIGRLEAEKLAKKEGPSFRIDPLLLGLAAAVVGLFSNALVAFINGENEQTLERQKSGSTLILQAITTGGDDGTQAYKLLDLIAKADLAPGYTANIKNYLLNTDPEQTAYRPLTGGARLQEDLKISTIDLKATKKARADDIAIDRINLSRHLPNFLNAFEHALRSTGLLANGFDGIYDGKTAEAVKKLQRRESEEETGWATPQQMRHAICFAAVDDPLSQQPRNGDYKSRINLASFYTEGIGYARDLSKAKYLVRTTIDGLSSELNKPGLASPEKMRLEQLLAAADQLDQSLVLRPVRVRPDSRPYSFGDFCPQPKP